MRIAYLELWWLTLIPVLILAFALYASWCRSQVSRALGEQRLVNLLITSLSLEKRIIKLALVLIASGLLAFAALRPQFGQRAELQVQNGIDIAVAFDISKSMLARDVYPSRLAAAQNALRELVGNLSSHRLALIPFAGIAFTQSPLTADKSAFNLFLRGLNPQQMIRGGTNIAAAISEGVKRLSGPSDRGDKQSRSRVLLLITDGEDLGRRSSGRSSSRPSDSGGRGSSPTGDEGEVDSPLGPDLKAAIEEANKNRVVIYTIAVGTRFGEPIPIVNKDGTHKAYQRRQGSQEIIYSKLNMRLLEAIVEASQFASDDDDSSEERDQAGSGAETQTFSSIQRVFSLDGKREVLSELETSLSRLKRHELESMIRQQYGEKYMYALIPALLLLWLEMLLSDRKRSAQRAQRFERPKTSPSAPKTHQKTHQEELS